MTNVDYAKSTQAVAYKWMCDAFSGLSALGAIHAVTRPHVNWTELGICAVGYAIAKCGRLVFDEMSLDYRFEQTERKIENESDHLSSHRR